MGRIRHADRTAGAVIGDRTLVHRRVTRTNAAHHEFFRNLLGFVDQASVMRSHRSLDAWKVARQLSIKVMQKTDDHYHPRARSLFDQLRRASVSIEANIVEGYALQTKPQFRRHLRIALGSGAETEGFLELIAALEYLPKDVVAELRDLTARSMALVYGLLRYLGRP